MCNLLCYLKEGGIVDMPVVVVAELKNIISSAYHLDHFFSVSLFAEKSVLQC